MQMFSKASPPPITPTPPPTAPDPFGPATLEASRAAMAKTAAQGGRDSTVLTTTGARAAGTFAGGATKLGSGS
jgi:hypothetical protein